MIKPKIIKFISPQEESSLENIDVPETSFWIEGVAVFFTPVEEELSIQQDSEVPKIQKNNKK